MRFAVDHIVAAPPEAVMAAFTDPDFLATMAELDKIGDPEILEQSDDGTARRQRIRYRFDGDLSSVALAAIDPAKLTWVDAHVYELERRRATFTIEPDHYADRFAGSGREQFLPVSEGTAWHIEVELDVRWPVVGTLVEKAIASGLRDTLAAEAKLLERWLSR
jgi:uncharacterized protein YndB with AHSA1/START domain